MEIRTGQLDHPAVIKLLEEHLADMNATSPPESVHALDVSSLQDQNVTFWSGWSNGQLLACAAMKRLDAEHVEIKSMRTSSKARKQGAASLLMSYALDFARENGFKKVSLETGSMEFFAPARALYEKFGFQYCGPFGNYTHDPNSQFMTLELRT